jgi:nitroimidazol reductase NimA-like FMN-containing flavoprotein (pyridoxamine 5'-phosphate oxidase superfamily)
MADTSFDVSSRTKLLRLAKRASYDRETVYDIVDAALVCHVGYAIDGQPHVIPTLIARDGNTLLLHGHGTNRTLHHAGAGHPICVEVTHVDGIVLTRSIFNHSINYRSAALYGTGRLVTDPDEKTGALFRFSEKLLPGRWDECRPMTDQELKATAIVALDIEDAVAKIRTGPPKDEEEDISWPTWAGVIPIETRYLDPVAEEKTPADMPWADSVVTFLGSSEDS